MTINSENTAPRGVSAKIQQAILKGYNQVKIPMPPDLDQRLEEGYDAAYEKKYNKEQELARRAQR